MKLKRLWGLLMILAVAIFTFTACSSSDDDNEQTGTFEYDVTYSSFNGNSTHMNKVKTAFKEAFGVTSTPITLTGTLSECNRKAKEYAIKAQASLANEGSFGAVVLFVNLTTDEQIHTFTIKKDDNGIIDKKGIFCYADKTSFTFTNQAGKRMKLVSYKTKNVVFDGIIETAPQTINIDRKEEGTNFKLITEDIPEGMVIRLDK